MFPFQLSGEIREGGGISSCILRLFFCFFFCSLRFFEDLAPTPVACKLRSGTFLLTRRYYLVGSSNTVNFHIEICFWSKAFHHSNEVSSRGLVWRGHTFNPSSQEAETEVKYQDREGLLRFLCRPPRPQNSQQCAPWSIYSFTFCHLSGGI